jgi:hypothetical protein
MVKITFMNKKGQAEATGITYGKLAGIILAVLILIVLILMATGGGKVIIRAIGNLFG